MTEGIQKDSKLLDSSIWLGYFLYGEFSEIIEKEDFLYLSVLSLFEVQKKLNKTSLRKEDIEKGVLLMRGKSIILDLTEEIADKAVDISIEKDMPSIDSMIYATSLSKNMKVYTKDNDFRGLTNAVVL
ncbi:MAG: PIN domain-containing protein [Nanoarchaeota archaeon]